IGDGEPRAEHRFRSDLVGHSQVRSERVRVGLSEATLACSLVFHCSNSPPNERVRKVEGGALLAAMVLLPGDPVIPSKTVVEGQLVSNFPIVLGEDCIGVVSQPLIRGRSGRYGGGQTEKEAGIPESAARKIRKGLAVLGGIGRLLLRECEF